MHRSIRAKNAVFSVSLFSNGVLFYVFPYFDSVLCWRLPTIGFRVFFDTTAFRCVISLLMRSVQWENHFLDHACVCVVVLDGFLHSTETMSWELTQWAELLISVFISASSEMKQNRFPKLYWNSTMDGPRWATAYENKTKNLIHIEMAAWSPYNGARTMSGNEYVGLKCFYSPNCVPIHSALFPICWIFSCILHAPYMIRKRKSCTLCNQRRPTRTYKARGKHLSHRIMI